MKRNDTTNAVQPVQNSGGPTTGFVVFGLTNDRLARVARALFFSMLALLVANMTLVLLGDPALAQQGGGGGGGAIQGAIDAATTWLSSIMTSLGGLGLIASVGVKAIARTNENMHHAAHMGMAGSGIAIVAGLLIQDIIALFTGFAGGG